MIPEQVAPRVALVIGSGGLKCAASIGIVQVLEEESINVDLVVGCSGGAVFGTGVALGYPSEKIMELCAQTWAADTAKKKNISSILKIISPKIFGFDDHIGIFDDRTMAKNLERAIGQNRTFEDTKIPFYCVATDFYTGEPVVISKGRLAKATRISSGIPIIFTPVEWEDKLLIDGGLSNPLPIDVAIQQGADIIIAVGFQTPLLSSVTSPGNYAMQMFNILVNQLLYKKFAFYNLAYHSEIIAIIPEFEEEIKINDISKIPYIIDQGKREAQKHITFLKQVISSATIDERKK